jgi:hypothetical protein
LHTEEKEGFEHHAGPGKSMFAEHWGRAYTIFIFIIISNSNKSTLTHPRRQNAIIETSLSALVGKPFVSVEPGRGFLGSTQQQVCVCLQNGHPSSPGHATLASPVTDVRSGWSSREPVEGGGPWPGAPPGPLILETWSFQEPLCCFSHSNVLSPRAMAVFY